MHYGRILVQPRRRNVGTCAQPNSANDGTACKVIEICSLSPPGDRQWPISTWRFGNRAVALVVSISVFGIAPLSFDNGHLLLVRHPANRPYRV